jgi:hypothetical protein
MDSLLKSVGSYDAYFKLAVVLLSDMLTVVLLSDMLTLVLLSDMLTVATSTAITSYLCTIALYVVNCPVVTMCSASLTFINSTFCPHIVFMCFVWISDQLFPYTPFIFL